MPPIDPNDPTGPDRGLDRRDFLAAAGAAALALSGCGRSAAPASAPLGPIPDLSASALADAIRAKRISSVEAVDALLARINAVNPQLNAVVQLAAEPARAEAKAADDDLAAGQVRGPLHGVPMTIKDSLDTKDVVTTGGTEGRAKFVPTEDATVVVRLRRAGAILLGKTNTPELTLSFETDNLVYGRTSNPYDLSRTPGGSSGGAAAIIAAGGAPFDLGSDTGGSIRLPSHFTGIAGIRPTTGRVPRTGHIIPADGLLQSYTQIGPMARRVQDLTLVLGVIAGPDGQDPYINPVPLLDPAAVNLNALRIGFFTDNGLAQPIEEIKATVTQAADQLAKVGAAVAEDRPNGIAEAIEIMNTLWLADGGAWIRRLLAKAGTKQLSRQIQGALSQARALPSDRVTELVERQDRLRASMLSYWANHDVLICPVHARVALPHGQVETPETFPAFSYTETFNFTGWPAGVVRCGTSKDGLPIGVQVVAPPWREDIVLAVLGELERAFGGWKPPPPAAPRA